MTIPAARDSVVDQNAFAVELREIVRGLRFYLEEEENLGRKAWSALSRSPATKSSPRGPRPDFVDPAKSLPASLEALRAELGDCRRCKLHTQRTQIVFGTGSAQARLVFVGEAPGRDEDLQGEPFVGQAGQLLTRIIQAIQLTRQDVYITNVIKCRPPGNRNPAQDEIAACEPFLIKQLQIIQPRLICALGTFAAQALLKSEEKISSLRGRFHEYQGIPLMPTYHPAFLLRNPDRKREVWEDMKKIKKEYDTL